jgi:hypothetical protein
MFKNVARPTGYNKRRRRSILLPFFLIYLFFFFDMIMFAFSFKKTASHETHNFFMSGNFGFYFPEISESVPTGSRVIIR